jgi:hypothetical protein
MFKHGLRTFATTALRSAEASTAYNTKVSTAQGWVNGLTEGRDSSTFSADGHDVDKSKQLAIRH